MSEERRKRAKLEKEEWEQREGKESRKGGKERERSNLAKRMKQKGKLMGIDIKPS